MHIAVSVRDCVEFRAKFFVCLGVCAEFYFVVFAKTDGSPCQEYPRGDVEGHATIYWEHVEPKNCVFYHARDHSVWKSSVG